jgi:hypothetical protein
VTTPIPQKDERAGLTSASSAEGDINCPGKRQAEKPFPPEPETDVAAQGSLIHGMVETGDIDEEQLDEATIAKRLQDLEEKAVTKWMADLGLTERPKPIREERIWFRDRLTMAPLASAKPDVLYVRPPYALIIDFKSGFLRATEAPRNWQLRTQALCTWHEYPELIRIRVAIAQHRFTSLLDPCDYDLNALQMSEAELLRGLWRSEQPDAPRNPGKWCRYCRAKQDCLSAAAWATLAIHEAENAGGVGNLDPWTLRLIWERSSVAIQVFESVKKALKALPPETLESLGLKLQGGNGDRTVSDIQVLFNILYAEGLMDAGTFRTICSTGIGKVEKACLPLLAQKLAITQADAKEKLNDILAPVITRKPKEPTLVVK